MPVEEPQLVQKVLSKLSQKPGINGVKFIAIDGRGGAGKSRLALWLGQQLNASIISTDDFASPDNPLDWWQEVIEKVFQPIQQDAVALSYPRSKWWPNHHPEPVKDLPVTSTMILEGVSASRREFRPYLSYCIWVETPKEVCLERGLERDKHQGSYEEIKKLWDGWFKKEDQYIKRDQPQKHADTIVDGTINNYG